MVTMYSQEEPMHSCFVHFVVLVYVPLLAADILQIYHLNQKINGIKLTNE